MKITAQQIDEVYKSGTIPRGQFVNQYRILPYEIKDNVVIFATDQSWTEESIITLKAELGLELKLNKVAACDEFNELINIFSNDDVYEAAIHTTVVNCDERFIIKCPLSWLYMDKTDNEQQRFCNVCQQTVYFANTEEEKQTMAKQGYCVAFMDFDDSIPADPFFDPFCAPAGTPILMGDMAAPDEWNIPVGTIVPPDEIIPLNIKILDDLEPFDEENKE